MTLVTKFLRKNSVLFALLSLIIFSSCASKRSSKHISPSTDSIATGADQLSLYLPLLKGKKVGLMGNQTSVVGPNNEHLVDVLLREGVDLKFGFAPEHGFRGNIERGEKVSNDFDAKTGLPLYTLYGGNEKQDSIVQSVDVMIFGFLLPFVESISTIDSYKPVIDPKGPLNRCNSS